MRVPKALAIINLLRRSWRALWVLWIPLMVSVLSNSTASAGVSQNTIRFKHFLDGEQTGEFNNINAVTTIVQDKLGYLWFGGENGLARFNGTEFEFFQKDERRANALSGSYVWDAVIDQQGELWVATAQGLNRFDAANHGFLRYSSTEDGPQIRKGFSLTADVLFSLAVAKDNSLYIGSSEGLFRLNPERTEFRRVDALGAQYIREIFADNDGSLWVGTSEQGLYHLDAKHKIIHHWRHNPADPSSLPHNYIRAVERDKQGRLWVGSLGGGIAKLAQDQAGFVRYQHQQGNPTTVGSNSIWDIHSDQDGNLWVASDPGGLALYLDDQDQFHTYRHSAYQYDSLSSDKVRVIFDDHIGDLWVGGFPSGINYYNKSTAFFRNYIPKPDDSTSLSHENVVRFFEDSKQQLWIGTEGGLNLFHRESDSFTSYLADENSVNGLRSNAVLAITEDAAGILWLGTWAGGLHAFNPQTQQFKQYSTASKPGYIAGNYIWSLLYDSQNRLWAGTENAGLSLYMPEQDRFLQFAPDEQDPESLSFRHVWALLEDSQKRIWVGTIDGLDLLLGVEGERARFKHYRHNPADSNSLSSNRIISLMEDRAGYLWVGTQDSGLNRLNVATGEITRLTISQGLPSNHISSLQEDNQGYIWLSTVNGIAMIHPTTLEVRSFGENSGLVTNHFNRDASFKDAQGKLYFGGAKGFSVFDPSKFNSPMPAPQVVISDFRLFNRSVYASTPSSPLTQAISETQELRLTYKHSMFAFDFFAVSFRSAQQNKYAYKLDGFDQQWNTVGNLHTATYTNIDPGDYVFRVRAANSDGIWNDEGASLRLHIAAPYWLTVWAYLLYAVCALALIGYILFLQKNKMLYKNQKLMATKLLKLDRLKDAFLANTSHELRTPLNGIIGLAETLQDGSMGELDERVKNTLRMISSSGRRLSNLINDILDYSKLSEHQLNIRKNAVDLFTLVETVLELLVPLLMGKDLKLQNDVPQKTCVMADDDRLQQILLNLVGNAIKFSHQGHVRVFIRHEGDMVLIGIEDTGPGIDPRDIQKIFSAFTQLDDDETREQGGTGLGLAITKQLVELHGGTIRVDSQRGVGSTFTFSLPMCEAASVAQAKELDSEVPVPLAFESEVEKLNPIVASDNDDAISLLKPAEMGDTFTVLIVDDDAINRMVLSSILAIQNYKVIEANSGMEALDLLHKHSNIDLVIMDVMMPKMSGYEACMRMRVEYPVHILPILFLTAKNFSDDLVRGFVAGGNDFLTKPVSRHELLSRVSTHLCLLGINRRLEEKYQQACSANVHNDKELRTLEHIVEIINREMDFRVLLKDLLFDVKGLMDADEIIYWQAEKSDTPHFAVLSGEVEGMNELCLHNGESIVSHLENMHNQGQSILILEDVNNSEFRFVGETFPGCVSSVLMTIYFEKSVVGFITVLSFNEHKRFSYETVSTLNRIHAHVTSAVVKAKLLEKLGLSEHLKKT